MDWKREAVDKLRCYEAKRSSIGRALEEIQRLREDSLSIKTSRTDAVLLQGGSSSWDDKLVNNLAHREELKRAISDARHWVHFVESGLATLDEEERLVLEMFYIHGGKGNVDRLCSELGVEKSSAYRRRDSALRHFTLALYGVVET